MYLLRSRRSRGPHDNWVRAQAHAALPFLEPPVDSRSAVGTRRFVASAKGPTQKKPNNSCAEVHRSRSNSGFYKTRRPPKMKANRRLLILTEGKSNPLDAKTAAGLIRYRTQEVAGILDSTCAGRTCEDVFGFGGDIPVVSRLEDVDATELVIGISPSGGRLPQSWRQLIAAAIARGMHIASGLHVFLGDDPEFHDLAARHGVSILDARRPPPDVTVGKDLVRSSRVHRVHAVGQDCSVGKMLVMLELNAALVRRGKKADFVATGQTGILISGWGVPADCIVSDFVAGAVEKVILEHEDQDLLLIEGQGSICHPLYSGVTLGLLHGCAPQTMILAFDPTRPIVRSATLPMPSLERLIPLYEGLASLLCPSKVVALAANTSELTTGEADHALRAAEDATGLPAFDVIRQGADPLADIVLARDAELQVKR